MSNSREKSGLEHRSQALAPRGEYLRRQIRHAGFGLLLVAGSLTVGMVGYRLTESMPWLDALLNASMILFGEGPVTVLQTSAGKLFATFYAAFSGVAFVTMIGVVFIPTAHRLLHKFHLEDTGRAKPKK